MNKSLLLLLRGVSDAAFDVLGCHVFVDLVHPRSMHAVLCALLRLRSTCSALQRNVTHADIARAMAKYREARRHLCALDSLRLQCAALALGADQSWRKCGPPLAMAEYYTRGGEDPYSMWLDVDDKETEKRAYFYSWKAGNHSRFTAYYLTEDRRLYRHVYYIYDFFLYEDFAADPFTDSFAKFPLLDPRTTWWVMNQVTCEAHCAFESISVARRKPGKSRDRRIYDYLTAVAADGAVCEKQLDHVTDMSDFAVIVPAPPQPIASPVIHVDGARRAVTYADGTVRVASGHGAQTRVSVAQLVDADVARQTRSGDKRKKT